MINSAKHNMGPVMCSNCSIEELLDNIKTNLRAEPREGMTINFINAHLYNLCWNDKELSERINHSDVIAADGMVIVWSAGLFGFSIPSRCNMTDSFRTYLADSSAPQSTAILIGGTQKEAERAAEQIQNDGPHVRISKTISGYHTIEEYEALFREAEQPDFVFVGMGTPKSEKLVEAASRIWPTSIVWHIGGGTIMFFAGSLVEAPVWMRKCGLQWLHRFLIEPRRMWKRYMIGNPLYIFRVLRAAIFHRRPSSQNVA